MDSIGCKSHPYAKRLKETIKKNHMRYYIKRNKSIEAISIAKIEMGINSIRKGIRTGEDVAKDLEYFFNRLEELNTGMYEDLFMKYSIARLEAEKKEIKNIHS